MNLYSIVPQGQGFMVGVQINPVPGLPSGFPVMSSYFFMNLFVILFYLLNHNNYLFDLSRAGIGSVCHGAR